MLTFTRGTQPDEVSAWTNSLTKRLFDCTCVLAALPFLLPVLVAVALAVYLTSNGPVLFIQRRVGCYGKTFPILKFRTMEHTVKQKHHAVTTAKNQRFTPVGPFLRRWKLDELPQLLNVLAGHMSLVGPRPKLPEHSKTVQILNCKPGITGAATVAFAREEVALARIPHENLDAFYHDVVLPAKLRLDAEYMANATFYSDFALLINTVLRRWDNAFLEELLVPARKVPAKVAIYATGFGYTQVGTE
ncbi:sugar transferase [Telmatobacter bradus]|uniref:sugar transferase n=1 Tax=Telmatobacter bradus TaxID=474953 RepID=UPI003B43CECF